MFLLGTSKKRMLFVAIMTLMAAMMYAGRYVKAGEVKPAEVKVDDTKISDATKEALLKPDDWALLKKAKSAIKDNGALSTLTQVHISDLVSNPETWTTADVKARTADCLKIQEINQGVSANAWLTPQVTWIALSTSPEMFMKRVNTITALCTSQKPAQLPKEYMYKAVMQWTESQPTLDTVDKKIAFCDWLRKSGLIHMGVEQYRKELIKSK